MNRVGGMILLGLLALSACSDDSKNPKQTASNGTKKTEQEVNLPQFSQLAPKPIIAPVAAPQPTPVPPTQPVIAPVAPDSPPSMAFEIVSLGPNVVLENERPIPVGASTPPGAVSFGFIRSPNRPPLLHFRLQDGKFARVTGTPMMVAGSGGFPTHGLPPAGSSTSGTSQLSTRSTTAAKQEATVDPEAKLPLPGEIDDIVVGGGGRYLLFAMRGIQKVGVLDVHDPKGLKYVNVEGKEFVVAAGATQFVVVDSVGLSLEAWKYDALEKSRAKAKFSMKGRKRLIGAYMGISSEGPLGISFEYDEYGPQQSFVELFDLATLTPMKNAIVWNGRSSFRLHEHWSYRIGTTPEGAFLFIKDDVLHTLVVAGSTAEFKPEVRLADSLGAGDAFIPAFDGRTFFRRGRMLLPEGRALHLPDGSGVLSPAIPSQFWVAPTRRGEAISEKTSELSFFLSGTEKPITKLRLNIGDADGFKDSRRLETYKRLFFNAYEKTLILAPEGRRELLVKRFDIDATIAKLDTNVLVITSKPPMEFTPGKKLEYIVQALSNRGGGTYRLEAGPPGMTVSPNGHVEWSAPADSPQQAAIIAVADKSGHQVFHNITLARGAIPMIEVPFDAVAPVDLNAPRVAIKLPAAADDFIVGGGGRYLLAWIKSKRQIAVIDVKARKLLKLLPADDDDVKIAAGATRFVTHSAKGTISRWSFGSLERESTEPCAAAIEAIAMGSASEGPVLLSVKAQSRTGVALFLDLETLKTSKLKVVDYQNGRDNPSIEQYLAASANGQTFVSWKRGSSTLGILSLVVRGDEVNRCDRHESAGPLTPSPDGSTIYTLCGNFDSRPVGDESARVARERLAPRLALPAATGNLYLSWSSAASDDAPREVTLHAQGNATPILAIPDLTPPGTQMKISDEDPLFSRRLLYAPAADAVITLGTNLDSIIIQRFVFDEALAKLGGDYLFVTSTPPAEMRPSMRLNYQVDVKSAKGGVKFDLPVAPTGATISPTGLVTWSTPPSLDGTHPFTVHIANAGGSETLHSFNIRVDKNASISKSGAADEVVDIGRPKKVVALPGSIEQLCVGGGGRYLVGFIKTLRQICVIDVQERKMLKLIPVDDDDVKIAAGATKFVVSLGTKGVLTRYVLAKCERDLTTAAPPAAKILSLTMGCNSEGPIYVGTQGGFRSSPIFLDLPTLKTANIALEENRNYDFGREVAFAADGRFFVSGSMHALVEDDKLRLLSGDRFNGGDFGIPSSDGRIVYSQGALWNVGGNLIGNSQDQAFNLPAAVGPFYVKLPTTQSRTKQVNPTLHIQGENQPLLMLDDIDVASITSDNSNQRSGIKYKSEQFFLMPTANAIVLRAPAGDSLTIYRFNLDEELKKTARDYLLVVSVAPAVVHPASSMEYQLDVRSKRGGVKYRLESGPPGMTVSTSGMVSWSAKGPDIEEKVAILAITDASGQELFHTFKFKIDATAEKKPAVGTTVPSAGAAVAPVSSTQRHG